MAVLISGKLPIQQLSRIADKNINVKDGLQQVPGVGQIKIVGKQEKEYLDLPGPLQDGRLSSLCSRGDECTRILSILNFLVDAFTSPTRIDLKIKAEMEEANHLKSIVVAYRNGYPVTFADIGRSRRCFRRTKNASSLR